MKAVETCFPQATTLLCCRHLEENVRRRLQDTVGVPAEVWQDIVRRVFGAEGLAGGRFRKTLDASGRLRTLFSMTAPTGVSFDGQPAQKRSIANEKCGWTDGRTDGQTDRHLEPLQYSMSQKVAFSKTVCNIFHSL